MHLVQLKAIMVHLIQFILSTHGRNGGGSCGGIASSYDGANAGDYGIERLDLYLGFYFTPTITTQPDDISYGGSERHVFLVYQLHCQLFLMHFTVGHLAAG